MDNNIRISLLLKIGRAALGWTQEELCDQLKIAKSTLARIEMLDMIPTGQFLIIVLRLFKSHGVDINIIEDDITIKINKIGVENLKNKLIGSQNKRSDRKKKINIKNVTS